MNTYTVLYHNPDDKGFDPPWSFTCEAETFSAAEEECEYAYPTCDIVWVVETDDAAEAYTDYWNALF